MDVILYGIYALDIVDVMHLTNQPWLELSRTPFAVNLGILGVFVVIYMTQAQVRFGLTVLGIGCLTVMTGIVFTGLFLAAIALLFLLARTLHDWSASRSSHGLPYLVGFAIAFSLYCPLYFVTLPQFEGFMNVGEVVLFWGPAFTLFRVVHYIHLACKQEVDPNSADAFRRYLLYMVHFPNFWFGPYQKFDQFDGEVDTCKQRITAENRREGLKRIAIGVIKFVFLFHFINIPHFYKLNYYGPFSDVFFQDAANLDPSQVWLLAALLALRITLFISAVSDGVIGMNLLMGIRVPENSNYPLLARDIQEFWRRWHIQAMVFLRDQVYFPVGGMRHRIRGFLAVFAFSGLWHFPSWSAVVVFPVLHLLLYEFAIKWRKFWKEHDRKKDRISDIGKRCLLHDSWLSGAVGITFNFFIHILSVFFIHDHFFGGTTVLPRMFGF